MSEREDEQGWVAAVLGKGEEGIGARMCKREAARAESERLRDGSRPCGTLECWMRSRNFHRTSYTRASVFLHSSHHTNPFNSPLPSLAPTSHPPAVLFSCLNPAAYIPSLRTNAQARKRKKGTTYKPFPLPSDSLCTSCPMPPFLLFRCPLSVGKCPFSWLLAARSACLRGVEWVFVPVRG